EKAHRMSLTTPDGAGYGQSITTTGGAALPGRPNLPDTADVREIAASYDIPADLVTYPGIQKNGTDEAYFSYRYPLRPLTSDYPNYSKWRWQVSRAMHEVKAVHGNRLASVRDDIMNFHLKQPEAPPSGANAAKAIKDEAKRLGFAMAGAVPFD